MLQASRIICHVRGQYSSRSASASAESDMRTTLSADKSMQPFFSRLVDGVDLWSDFLAIKADPELHFPHMTHCQAG